ncbi:MAG: hypothetical protein ABSF95_11355 [Verrucomicrobiota bacterium]
MHAFPLSIGQRMHASFRAAAVTALGAPKGDPNAEVQATATFDGLYIAPGQGIRWKVVSAPDGPATAWHASLALEAQGAAR